MELLRALEFGAAAVLLYELAHIAAALALKVKVRQVGISWRGVYIRRDRGTPRRNLAIALSGPAITLGLALLIQRVSPGFAFCSVVVGLTNLLPMPASDGLRALRLLRNFGALKQPLEAPPAPVVDISLGRRTSRAASPFGASWSERSVRPAPRRSRPQYERVRITSGQYKGRFIGTRVTGLVSPEILLSRTVYSLHDQARVAARFFDLRATQVQAELKAMGFDSELV